MEPAKLHAFNRAPDWWRSSVSAINSTGSSGFVSGPLAPLALKTRLKYGNEFSLRRRLKDLAKFHDVYARSVLGKPGEFADSIANLRNELAHALGAKKPESELVREYFVQLHRTRLLFQLELLYHLGFDSDFLKGCISRLESAGHVLRNVH